MKKLVKIFIHVLMLLACVIVMTHCPGPDNNPPSKTPLQTPAANLTGAWSISDTSLGTSGSNCQDNSPGQNGYPFTAKITETPGSNNFSIDMSNAYNYGGVGTYPGTISGTAISWNWSGIQPTGSGDDLTITFSGTLNTSTMTFSGTVHWQDIGTGHNNCSGSESITATCSNCSFAPTGVTATPGNGQVTIAWTAVSGATSYNIYWSQTSGVTTANGTKITGVTSPYTQTGLTNGTTYYYIVTAVDSSGESSASTQVSATPNTTGTIPVALPKNALGLFVVTIGGSSSDYVGYGLTVDSTSYLVSMVIPSTKQWVVRSKYTSQSYASATVSLFEQDSQAFMVTSYLSQCDLEGMGTFTPNYTPQFPLPTQIKLINNGSGSNSIYGWELNHIGMVGNSVYYIVPVEWNPFTLSYNIGGQLDVMASGGTVTTLLSQNAPDNGATADMADKGTLYAIYHNSTNGTLTVWTRDLTTGKLATQLRNDSIASDATLYRGWSFKINDGILYAVRTNISDSSFDVLSVNLSDGITAPWQLLQNYPASSGGFYTTWGVDNGHVVIAFTPPGSIKVSSVADLDTATKTTQYYDLGSTTSILSLAPVWIPGP